MDRCDFNVTLHPLGTLQRLQDGNENPKSREGISICKIGNPFHQSEEKKEGKKKKEREREKAKQRKWEWIAESYPKVPL